MAGKKKSTEKDKLSLKILEKLVKVEEPESIYRIQRDLKIRDFRTVLRKVNRLGREGLIVTTEEKGGRQARLSSITEKGVDFLFITHKINEDEYADAFSYIWMRAIGFPEDKKLRKDLNKAARKMLKGTLYFDMETWIAWTKDALNQKAAIKTCEEWIPIFENALDDDTSTPEIRQLYEGYIKDGEVEKANRKRRLNELLGMMQREIKHIKQL